MKPGPIAVSAAAFLCSLVMTGCDSPSAVPAAAPEDPTSTERLLSGREAYEKVCAGCHETGADGAPRTDDPAAWSDRSSLWQAVLFEHARAGYIDMPARGGDETLTDPVVEAAAEYMLSLTMSSQPPDADE
jgi:cytochrome c5